MPSRLALRSAAIRAAFREPYVCPSCCLLSNNAPTLAYNEKNTSGQVNNVRGLQTNGQPRARQERPRVRKTDRAVSKRHASLTFATAINVPSTVPPEYRELHQQLSALQESASGYVDLSRLQLALRSLESDTPVVRVALLGLGSNGALAARKLARALLSDPLSNEESWEQQILQSAKDGRSLLLRYGEAEEMAQQSSIMQTLHVPSPWLRRHNVEILVSTLNTDHTGQVSEQEMEEAILVPPLTTPNAGGRVGFVRYPVHKALLVGEGVTGAVEYGRLPSFVDREELIKSTISLSLRPNDAKPAEEGATDDVVDVDLATNALHVFRTTKAAGAQYSTQWHASRIPMISQWLAGPQERQSSGLNPVVHSLCTSLLRNTSAAVSRSETDSHRTASAAVVPEVKRQLLDKQIDLWASDAHRDLQTNLTSALQSATWRRTAWWRLLWRIDDVSASASDILRLSWLTEAEQSLAFLSGRLAEAGLATPAQLKEIGIDREKIEAELQQQVEEWQPKAAQILSPADLLQTNKLVEKVKRESGVNALFDPPWPQTIHLSRQQLLHNLVPSLHRQAQSLLLSTISTVGGTTALGAWLTIATSGDLFAGGAVAALGLVWSLRRLQKLWGKERESFAVTVKEDGRNVLAEVERQMRRLVKEGGKIDLQEEDLRSWREARVALERCRSALGDLAKAKP
ncbi:hypothetical protein KC360_g9078 [Hortaea werneckii]|nr:hypothetical protein KC325_g7080 [Hortaea werneckii]KAI6988929.1 hypothetical protein KC359_g7488 [Hortaea werneckii]KAI7142610.1 hypothetical protein KC344_g7026 [Hortaea werneckii]KAI7166640.1 hypothetical protein KC360_g9078 [Hortaea werneckii]